MGYRRIVRVDVSEAGELRARVAVLHGELYVRVADIAELMFEVGGRTHAARYAANMIELAIRRAADEFRPPAPPES